VTNCSFTTVNLQMLIALYAHREFHDLRARDVGVERCSCALCLNDDAAIQGAIKMGERYKPIIVIHPRFQSSRMQLGRQVGNGQVARLLLGDDLYGLPGRGESRE
jgi:hypothetical protein